MLSRTITISRRDLPHWQTEEGTYFVTFRLFDSLAADLARPRGGKRVEEALDRGHGSAFLARPEIGEMVYSALRFFDGKRYVLHSACVMPNHVHVVFRTATGVRLSDVMHTWRGSPQIRRTGCWGEVGRSGSGSRTTGSFAMRRSLCARTST